MDSKIHNIVVLDQAIVVPPKECIEQPIVEKLFINACNPMWEKSFEGVNREE